MTADPKAAPGLLASQILKNDQDNRKEHNGGSADQQFNGVTI
jgi:hypothetical protein